MKERWHRGYDVLIEKKWFSKKDYQKRKVSSLNHCFWIDINLSNSNFHAHQRIPNPENRAQWD